jgi:hypothetical protein
MLGNHQNAISPLKPRLSKLAQMETCKSFKTKVEQLSDPIRVKKFAQATRHRVSMFITLTTLHDGHALSDRKLLTALGCSVWRRVRAAIPLSSIQERAL